MKNKESLMYQQLSGSVSVCEEDVLACVRLEISVTQILMWKELKLNDIYPCMLCDKHLKPHNNITVHADLDETYPEETVFSTAVRTI